jgi:peptide chain release factor subunit 1
MIMKTFRESVLILTPVKNAASYLPQYFRLLDRLSYPSRLISLGFLESDSSDGTYRRLAARKRHLEKVFNRVSLWRRNFNFTIPDGIPRWEPGWQIPRRRILAKSRNHLLFRSLREEDWVLWLDVDVIDYPSDMIETLLDTERDIVHPHCVVEYGGKTFDLNAWRDHGTQRMEDLRGNADLVRLDAVGGTVLLVRADIHRDGLIFPPYFYGQANQAARRPHPLLGDAAGEIETEGLGLMAKDMGYQCWGMPNYEVKHAPT